MDMNDWVMLMTALGGIEGIKQLIKWWMSRKTNARIEDAHADVEEFKALREYNEFLQKQLSEKEQRFVEQTDRLRKVQDELFTLKEANSDLKLNRRLNGVRGRNAVTENRKTATDSRKGRCFTTAPFPLILHNLKFKQRRLQIYCIFM